MNLAPADIQTRITIIFMWFLQIVINLNEEFLGQRQ